MKYCRSMLVAGLAALVVPGFALDFETSGETLSSIFQKLGKETGMTLRVNADVANEVLVIRAKNVDATTLLKKIGDATGLTWSQEEGGYRLSRHFLEEQKAAAEYRDYTVAAWNEWKQNPPTNRTSPVDDIMKVFIPENIANMTIGGRLVFSDKPNRNQTFMTNEVRSIATSTVSRIHQERIDRMEAQYAQRPNERFRQLIDSRKTPPSKVILVIRRQSLNTFTASLEALDATGNEVFDMSGTYALSTPSAPTDAIAGWTLPEGSQERANLKLLISSSSNSNGTDTSLLRQSLMDPVNHEPFAIAIGPALLASAPANQNFVACLPDESFDRIATGLDSQGPAGLSGTGVMAEKDADGWVVIKPQLRVHNWDTRRDRQALIPLIRKIASSGILSINDQADYAKTVTTWFSTNSWEYNLARRTLGASASRELSRISGSQIEGFAIYNMLRSKLNGQDQVLPLSSLTRDFVSFTVFNSATEPRVLVPDRDGGNRNDGEIRLTPQMFQTLQRQNIDFDARRAGERTELYAGGLPTTGQIEVDFRGRDAYVVRAQDGSSQSVMSENDLTRFRASQLSSNIRMRDGGLSATNNVFGTTNTTTISFDIQFSDGTSFSRSISGTDAPTGFVAYNNLPQTLLSEIEREAVEMAERANRQGNRGDRRGNRGGGTPPPQ